MPKDRMDRTCLNLFGRNEHGLLLKERAEVTGNLVHDILLNAYEGENDGGLFGVFAIVMDIAAMNHIK